ncbi:hypothetical protein V502_09377 [Pseudogymnoascus sp. VKM F-4520 (FW-2644)]|nr:hypothetical protein V502_09377 [Pseudogymnoascus sp. VKM F-4520 (FW-2644)]
MLVLIAGITGNVGKQAALAGLDRGHQIRGLGRSPTKLDPAVLSRLESFVQSENYYDIAALEQAVQGVDAVICAYGGLAELALEGQLLLLRAAERAGIKRFLAASWNYDWRRISLGFQEVYDPYIAFHAQASLSSSIKTLHILTGMLAEVFFGSHEERGFTPADDGVWDPEPQGAASTGPNHRVRSMDVYGTGNEPWFFTTEADAGAFSIEVVTGPDAEKGGLVNLVSWVHSLREVAEIYQKVHPEAKVDIVEKGSLEELEKKAVAGREKWGRSKFWEYHRLFFQLFTIKGTWNLGKLDNDRYPGVKATSLEQFLKENPNI